MYQWHRFIQTLADGNTPETFFAHLPSSPTMSDGRQHLLQAGKEHRHRSCLLLMVEETRQHAQQIFEDAAGAQEVAKAMVRMCRQAQQRRRSA
jgi:hypothetical protein